MTRAVQFVTKNNEYGDSMIRINLYPDPDYDTDRSLKLPMSSLRRARAICQNNFVEIRSTHRQLFGSSCTHAKDSERQRQRNYSTK